MKKYNDISYEKMHLRDHKSILHLSPYQQYQFTYRIEIHHKKLF